MDPPPPPPPPILEDAVTFYLVTGYLYKAQIAVTAVNVFQFPRLQVHNFCNTNHEIIASVIYSVFCSH